MYDFYIFRRTLIVDEFVNCSRLDFPHVYDFHSNLRHIYPSEFTLPRVKAKKSSSIPSLLLFT